MSSTKKRLGRILDRRLAHELTPEELDTIRGGARTEVGTAECGPDWVPTYSGANCSFDD